MRLPFLWLAFSVWPALGQAQVAEAASAAANPAAAVAAPAYESAFPPRPSAEAASDNDWQAANDSVARYPRGHADIVKAEKALSSGAQMPPPSSGTQHR